MNSPLMEFTVEETDSGFATAIPGRLCRNQHDDFFNKFSKNALFCILKKFLYIKAIQRF